MKKLILPILIFAAFATSLFSADGVLVSQTTKTIDIAVTNEWRTVTFTLSPHDHTITVNILYEAVTYENGKVAQRDIIRGAVIDWATATNIAPSLSGVRAEFRTALPLILTNAP